MMLQRELCELKIDELIKTHKKLITELDNGKCTPDYFKINSAKVMGVILGISFALGYDVENKIEEWL